eukprot:287665_1
MQNYLQLKHMLILVLIVLNVDYIGEVIKKPVYDPMHWAAAVYYATHKEQRFNLWKDTDLVTYFGMRDVELPPDKRQGDNLKIYDDPRTVLAGPWSTSKKLSVAKGFADRGGGRYIIFQVTIPKGYTGNPYRKLGALDLEGLSSFTTEEE